MLTSLFQFKNNNWSSHPGNKITDADSIQLVICFGGKDILSDPTIYSTVKKQFPTAQISMCSTAGEIYNDSVLDDSLIAVAMHFEKTRLHFASVSIHDFNNSYEAAVHLASQLPKEDLSYMMVFSDGSLVNGSELVKGLNTSVPENVLISGGMAGDNANFKSTLVGLNKQPKEGEIVVIGFYGKNLVVKHGSVGGWDMFGVEKEITKSTGNVLYEIDHTNALELYKKYLGAELENLPASALLFPLGITIPGNDKPIVRTILSIDETNKTMTFAGDVPMASTFKLMRSNIEKLTKAASEAAMLTKGTKENTPSFALLVSCVGRKLIMGTRTDEEVEAVNNIFDNKTLMAGFYSYGELSPFNEGGNCQLHNQTMTITTFYELP